MIYERRTWHAIKIVNPAKWRQHFDLILFRPTSFYSSGPILSIEDGPKLGERC